VVQKVKGNYIANNQIFKIFGVFFSGTPFGHTHQVWTTHG